MCVSTLLI